MIFTLAGTASDLPEMLAVIEQHEPGAVITDIRMPPTSHGRGTERDGSAPPTLRRCRRAMLVTLCYRKANEAVARIVARESRAR
jgi:CheY-like chemotaxis protein